MIELRRQLRKLRKSVDEKTRKEDGQRILHQCQKNGLFKNAKHIAIFTPNDGEIETEDTIKFLIMVILFTSQFWLKKNLNLLKWESILEKIDLESMSQSIPL